MIGHADVFRRVAAFDVVLNNADRKSGHCLLENETGRIWVVDHGVCFPTDPKLRTVIWDFVGEPFPDELTGDLGALRYDPPRLKVLEAALSPLVSNHELDALYSRWDRLLANPCFPQLDPYRNVPWPPF